MLRLSLFAIVIMACLTSPASSNNRVPGCGEFHQLDDVNRDLVVVKFHEGTSLHVRSGAVCYTSGADVSMNEADIRRDLDRFKADIAVALVETITPRIQFSEQRVDELRELAEQRSGKQMPDMNLYVELHLASLDGNQSSRERLSNLLLDLEKLAIIQTVYAEPVMAVASLGRIEPLPAWSSTTPDFSHLQDYLYDAPVGVEADEAWAFPGGRGQSVNVVDIEGGWRFTHEDLKDPFYTSGNPGVDDHGTAVLGEISGIDNGFGVIGISPDVEIGGASVNAQSMAEAVLDIAANTFPGDIFLIELHGVGPLGNWLPMEFWQDNFDAFQIATALGLICCEAAGNGAENLDRPEYNGAFDRHIRDSGAIMCGAGTPFGLEGEWFTNYGTRVDLQGWGSSVVTTCCGDLHNTGLDSTYTAVFNGTSSATPIVTGAVASLQGQAKALFGVPLRAQLAADILSMTGSPYQADKQIGERPNLLQARDLLIQGYAGLTLNVRDADSHMPLPGMIIKILETGRLIITDENGVAEFQLSAGDYNVQTSSFFYAETIMPVSIEGSVDQELFFDVPLSATCTVNGYVRDEEMTTLAGARIELLESPFEPIFTLSDGSYSFAGIPGGSAYQFLVGGIPGLSVVYRELDLPADQVVYWTPVLMDAEDFEATNGGLIGAGLWEWGQPSGPGPGGAFSGEKCWGTDLDGFYGTYQWMNLESPEYDVSEAEQVRLSFHHWYWIHENDDGGNVQVFHEGSWHVVEPVSGYDANEIPILEANSGFTGDSNGWQDEVFDLTPYTSSSMRLRIRFASDGAGIGPGWFIDDVALDTGGGYQAIELEADPAPHTAVELTPVTPNPADKDQQMTFHLKQETKLDLHVLNIEGRTIRSLWAGRLPGGAHVITWDGRDDQGLMMSAGHYFLRLRTSTGYSETRSIIRLR